MKYLIAIPILAALTGCITDPIRVKVAGAFDAGLEKSEVFICNDATVGSIIRRYGVSTDRAKIWKDFCFGSTALDVATDK